MYEQKEYQDCIDFIDYDIFQNEKVDLSDDRIADLYYLKAESCFELEDYGEAVKAFKKVFQHGGQKVSFTVITPLHLLIMMNWIRQKRCWIMQKIIK